MFTTESLEENRIKFTFTLTREEIQPYLEQAATHLSEHSSIPGFRPGKAGYDVVKQRFGEMKILEEALESIVRAQYVKALLESDLEVVGSPKIDVEKMAPDNDLVFTAEVTRMPQTTDIVDYKKLEIKKDAVRVEDSELELALTDLQRMQTKEVRAPKDTPTTAKDKVVVSMTIKKDGVAIEGGSSPNHAIYLSEQYYIPGLQEKLIGMKEGEEKTFTLTFPKEHVQKMLAGHEAEFEVTLKELYHLEPPTLDDAFATSLGVKDFAMLKDLIKTNLQNEKEQEQETKTEKEMLELLVSKSRFENIPDLLLNEEINKMIEELKHNVEAQGVEFDTYLSNLKRTLAQIKMDFTPQALMRIKVAILLRALAQQEQIAAAEKEVDEELDRIAGRYEDAKIKERIYDPTYREYVEHMLRNRKTIAHIKQAMVKTAQA